MSLAFVSFTKKYSGWPLYVTCAPPVVPTSAVLAPLATAGLPLARSGGQAAAHAPEHALVVPESFVNRYRVRPFAPTRILPRRLFATLTATVPLAVWRCGAGAVALPLPPPQAAIARAVSGTRAAAAKALMPPPPRSSSRRCTR